MSNILDGLFGSLLGNLHINGGSGNARYGFNGGDLGLSFGGGNDNFSWDTGNLFAGFNERRWEREERARDRDRRGLDGYDPYNPERERDRYSHGVQQDYRYDRYEAPGYAPRGYEAAPQEEYRYPAQRYDAPLPARSDEPRQYRDTGISFNAVRSALGEVDQVAQMQTMLASLGYGEGGTSRFCRDPQTGNFLRFSPIDGDMGPGTTAAFIDFAMQRGIDPRDTDRALLALEREAGGRSVTLDEVRAPGGRQQGHVYER
jgi:hypothetical protein